MRVGLFMRAGALVCLGYVLFGLVTVGGARGATVLIALPALRLPAWLGGVVLGGPVTAEALAWGATRGLSIWTLMVVFGAFNALVDHHRLLRLTPPRPRAGTATCTGNARSVRIRSWPRLRSSSP